VADAAAAASASQQLQIANMYASIFSRLQQQQQQQQHFSGGNGDLSPKQASVYPAAGMQSHDVPRLLCQLTGQVMHDKETEDEEEEDEEEEEDDEEEGQRRRRRAGHPANHPMPFDLSSRRQLSPARGTLSFKKR